MYKGLKYNIQPIGGENYDDCEMIFGELEIAEIDAQYFRGTFAVINSDLDKIWWDSKGFKITEIE